MALSLKLKKGDIIDVSIDSLSFGGSGFAKYNDIVIFVEGGLPGQKIKAKLL